MRQRHPLRSACVRHAGGNTLCTSAVDFGMVFFVLLHSMSASAQDTARFESLQRQFDRQYSARQDEAALKTAGRMRAIAEGSLKTVPNAMIIAVRSQGLALARVGNHLAAEPLLRWTYRETARVQGQHNAVTAQAATNLGRTLLALGRHAEAEHAFVSCRGA